MVKKVDIKESTWHNSYQIGNEARLTFQKNLVGIRVGNKLSISAVEFADAEDVEGFARLYEEWHAGAARLVRGISSNHFSWNEIITSKVVTSEGVGDVPKATMVNAVDGSECKTRWLPTALNDREGSGVATAVAVAMGNKKGWLGQAIRNCEDVHNILAGMVLIFKVGKDSALNINYLNSGEIVVQGPVHYPNFRIDKLVTADFKTIDFSSFTQYDDFLPLAAPYVEDENSENSLDIELAKDFIRKSREKLILIRKEAVVLENLAPPI